MRTIKNLGGEPDAPIKQPTPKGDADLNVGEEKHDDVNGRIPIDPDSIADIPQ